MARGPRQPTLDELLSRLSEGIKDGTRLPNIRKYAPHEKQYLFHSSPKKRKLYIGGNRSGKTTAGVCEGIWRATGKHPYRPELNLPGVVPSRGRVVGVDFIQGIDKIIVPQYKQWTPPSELAGGSWEKAYSSGSRTLSFANGSFIEFMSYDQDLDKFAGTSRHWIHFDEEPPRPIWVECLARLVDTDGEFWITMTPVEGMTWIYDDLYENNLDNPDGPVEIITINTYENPYLTESGIKGLEDVIDDDDKTARLGGNFVTVGGRIYKEFDPTPGSGQVLPDAIDDPATMFPERQWQWLLCLDHGLNNPTAALWLAIDPQGFIVCFDEYYEADRTVDQNAKAIKQIISKHGRNPDLLVADPSIKNRSPLTGTSIQQEYIKYGLPFTLGNNDVSAGIVRTKKYFKRRKYVSAPWDRPLFYGGPTPGTDTSLWLPPKEWEEPYGLYISPKCIKLIWELKRYRWQTYANKKLAFERNAYEVPNKKDDHACDALRYGIMSRPDLYAADTTHDTRSARELMSEIDRKLAETANPLGIDDPHGRLEHHDWQPLSQGTHGPLNEGWEYDEHMGGYY